MSDGNIRTNAGGQTSGLAKVGIWSLELRFGNPSQAGEAVAELEQLGFDAVWIPGGIGGDLLSDVARLLDASRRVTIGTGVLNIYKHAPADIGKWWHGRSAADRARLMLGLGVSHAPLIGAAYGKPLAAMSSYLDELDKAGIPAARRCLAALGPKMLALSRDRTAGSHPYLVGPAHTAMARKILGPHALLVPEQAVILETDPARAREMARTALELYLHLPNYLNNWRRTGFSEEDVTLSLIHI